MAFNIDTYYTEFGGAKNKIFRRNFFFLCDETLPQHMANFLEEYQYTDCYQCLYRYSSQDENALLYAPFYLDLDADITTETKYKAIYNAGLAMVKTMDAITAGRDRTLLQRQ